MIGSAANMLNQSLADFDRRRSDAHFGGRRNGNPSGLVWWKTHDGRKVEVERNQTVVLPKTYFEDSFVARATKTLLENGFDTMAGLTKKMRRSRTQVLVKVKLHAALLPV